MLLEELKTLGVALLTKVEYKDISDEGIRIIQDGKEHILPFDTLVIATGVRANNDLYKKLEGNRFAVILIGDAKRPGDASEAIEEARLLAIDI